MKKKKLSSAAAHVCHISAVRTWHKVTYRPDDPKMDSSILRLEHN